MTGDLSATTRTVCMVFASSDLGGAEYTAISWMKHLPALGWRMVAFVPAPGRLRQQIEAAGIPVITGHGRRFRNLPATAGDMLAIARLARRSDAALIHSSGTKAHAYGGPAALLAGLPAVWSLYDYPSAPSRWLRLAGRIPGHAIADSTPTALAAVSHLGYAPPVVYEAIEPADYAFDLASRTRVRFELGCPDFAPLFGFIGRLQRWKGVHIFIRALASAAAQRPGIRGVVVGSALMGLEEEYESELLALSAELGLIPATLSFLPFRPGLAGTLSGLDAMVHCSVLPESFGRVVVEAMACGRWVIAAAEGGPVETLGGDPAAGQLVKPGDIDDLAGAMVRFVDDRSLRASAAEAGPRVAARYSAAASTTELVAQYQAATWPRR